MQKLLLLLLCCLPNLILGQQKGFVLDQSTKAPLPFASVYLPGEKTTVFTNIDGSFEINISQQTQKLEISYLGYQTQYVPIQPNKLIKVYLAPKAENLKEVAINTTYLAANKIIKEAIAKKSQNDPDLKLNSYQYNSYNKLIIDNESQFLEFNQINQDNVAIKTLIEKGRAYLTEQISDFAYNKEEGLKETITATRTAGFKKPVYQLLSIKVQSSSWYKDSYTIFGTSYAGPLGNKAFKNYHYKILDTLTGKRPAYVIYFHPKRQQVVAGLEGILHIDTTSYAIQKAKGQLKGNLIINASQDFEYFPSQNIWFPTAQSLTLKPGKHQQEVAIFGGNIRLGNISPTSAERPLYLKATQTNQDLIFNKPVSITKNQSAVTLLEKATQQPESFWQKNRTIPFTKRDENTFTSVSQRIEKENINRKIDIVENFKIGYFPISFLNIDLRKLVKYNNYESFRLGTGLITNDKLSSNFKLHNYIVYGFKDDQIKYGFGGALKLNKNNRSWLDISYIDDIEEVGAYQYLTDQQSYSLFEPRLVNINFYYKTKEWSSTLTHRFSPQLKSSWQLSHSAIDQTTNYRYEIDSKSYKNYQISKVSVGLEWSPFSEFLTSNNKIIELDKNYPKFSLQVEQAFRNVLDSDFSFTKIGAKINYSLQQLNQQTTEVILEGNYAAGELPLTHSFHAYPNNPTKDALLQRFSVAGIRTFETMYFSEFFSDKQLNLQVKHFFKSWYLWKYSQPQLVLISRHAIGDMAQLNNHINLDFKTLNHGYNEAGVEINQLLMGFGISAAYRYGAYHLPNFEDNISLKFTFNLKL